MPNRKRLPRAVVLPPLDAAPPAPVVEAQNIVGEAVVKIGRRHLVLFATLGLALMEAHSVSTGSFGRCVYVVDLARYFDGERTGYVVTELAKAAELKAAAAIVVAL